MTRIKATSDCCGDVELAPTDVLVVTYSDPDRAWYGFTCHCGNRITKPAPADVIALLRTGGVVPRRVELEVCVAPPLNLNDLHDFLIDLALDREDSL